jgi:hypothetical protein
LDCPFCDRDTAGHPTKRIGVVSLADHKREPRALVLCPGSMHHMVLPDAPFVQEMLVGGSISGPDTPGAPPVVETLF